MQQFTNKCEYCSAPFKTEFPTKLYCSRYHKEQARELRKRNRRTKVKTIAVVYCKGCGLDFTSNRSNQVYCSSECRKWHIQQLKTERDKQYKNQLTPSFKRRVYFKTDGICGICQEAIDIREKYPSKKSFSIDHIIPRSKGGSHSFDNLQPAHLGCNERRQDRAL